MAGMEDTAMSDLGRGYSSVEYAISMQEFGEPRELSRCGGWILVRRIPGTNHYDAMGCYPLFACRDWTRLHEDLGRIGSDLVSLSIVVDPFSGVSPIYLRQCFDLVKPFKTHYVVDLSRPFESFIGKTHRKNARKSLEAMEVEVCRQPVEHLPEWISLYDNLVKRHNIRGISAFSPRCFELQLKMQGMIMFLGKCEGRAVGATLVLTDGMVAHFHLSAYTVEGYKLRASYGTHWKALEYGLEQGVRYFNIGGAAGLQDDPKDSLAEFKRGWSNERRATYLCGRVFDRSKYDSICREFEIRDVDYFPAYRVGEFKTRNTQCTQEEGLQT
jgi:hypothetical protein